MHIQWNKYFYNVAVILILGTNRRTKFPGVYNTIHDSLVNKVLIWIDFWKLFYHFNSHQCHNFNKLIIKKNFHQVLCLTHRWNIFFVQNKYISALFIDDISANAKQQTTTLDLNGWKLTLSYYIYCTYIVIEIEMKSLCKRPYPFLNIHNQSIW